MISSVNFACRHMSIHLVVASLQMVAADIYSAFNEAGFGNAKEVAHVGKM